MAKPSQKLTARQRRFTAEYLKAPNGAAAARKAGYSVKGASVRASQLLANSKVRAKVAEGFDKAGLTAERVLEEIRRSALEDRTQVIACRTIQEVQALPAALRALVTGFEVFEANIPGLRDGKTDRVRRVAMVDKMKALELAAKHLKLLTEVHEHTVSFDDALRARVTQARARVAKAAKS